MDKDSLYERIGRQAALVHSLRREKKGLVDANATVASERDEAKKSAKVWQDTAAGVTDERDKALDDYAKLTEEARPGVRRA